MIQPNVCLRCGRKDGHTPGCPTWREAWYGDWPTTSYGYRVTVSREVGDLFAAASEATAKRQRRPLARLSRLLEGVREWVVSRWFP